jgi:hypothetical protein
MRYLGNVDRVLTRARCSSSGNRTTLSCSFGSVRAITATHGTVLLRL